MCDISLHKIINQLLTQREIVEAIAKDRTYFDMCKKICPDNYDDLWQEVLLIILEYNSEKLIAIHSEGKLKFFVCKIMMNQNFSSTSPFHKKYRAKESFYKSDIAQDPYDYEEDILLDKALTEISLYGTENDNNWYRAELFKLYLKEGSIRALSKKTSIPVMSIHRSLNEFKADIKKRINENTSNTSIPKRKRNKLLQAINATRLSENL